MDLSSSSSSSPNDSQSNAVDQRFLSYRSGRDVEYFQVDAADSETRFCLTLSLADFFAENEYRARQTSTKAGEAVGVSGTEKLLLCLRV